MTTPMGREQFEHAIDDAQDLHRISPAMAAWVLTQDGALRTELARVAAERDDLLAVAEQEHRRLRFTIGTLEQVIQDGKTKVLIRNNQDLQQLAASEQRVKELDDANMRLRDIINLPLNSANKRCLEAEQELNQLRAELEVVTNKASQTVVRAHERILMTHRTRTTREHP